MDIVQDKNGKKTFKMSRQEWTDIGKRAGFFGKMKWNY